MPVVNDDGLATVRVNGPMSESWCNGFESVNPTDAISLNRPVAEPWHTRKTEDLVPVGSTPTGPTILVRGNTWAS